MKYRFWRFVHDKLEIMWHWVYYHKLKPLETIEPIAGVNVMYLNPEHQAFVEYGAEPIAWYRQNPDGTLTDLGGNVDVGQK